MVSRVKEISSKESTIFWRGIERGVMTFSRADKVSLKIKMSDLSLEPRDCC